MSGAESCKVDIDMVHNCIEQCLKLYMSKKEAANTLSLQKNIQPQITELIWQRLEEQNQEFFRAYYLKLAVKQQIVEFNRLLAEQVDLMRKTGIVNIPSMPKPDVSNISSVQQIPHSGENRGCALESSVHAPTLTNFQQIPHSGENLGCALESSDVRAPTLTNLPNAFTNHGTTMNSCMQSAHGISNNGRGVDVPSNMLLAQNGSMGMQPTLNGMVVKRDVYATSSFNCALPNDVMRSHSALANASMPSFSSVDSSLQSLNGYMLDTDDSSSGFLGQFSQNFSFHHTNMTSGISATHDILDSYFDSPLFASNLNNILDPQGYIGRFR